MSRNGFSDQARLNWWTTPGGGREVLKLAIPLVVSTSSWTIMHFIDRLFLLWHSEKAMAAALPAGLMSFSVECFFLGVAAYVNTFVAQYCGANRPERIGLATWQGVWLGFLSAPLLLATIPLAPYFFRLVGHDPEVTRQEIAFYQILCYGGGAMVLAAALSSFFTGRGCVRTVAIVDSISAIVNIVLDYAWIFGHWGFPAAGIVGAAWATVVAIWVRPILYFALMLRREPRIRYQVIEGCRFDRELFLRLMRFGSPAGVQLLFEVSAFTGFLMLVGRLGPLELTATNLAFNVNALGFVPMLGFGMAVSTLVGQHLGENRPDRAARGTWTAFWMATAYMAAIGALYLIFPGFFLLPHGSHIAPGQFAALRDLTITLLRFVAAYCLFDTMNIVFVGALKGAGDTRFILYTTLAMSGVPLAVTWYGTEVQGMNIYGCWTVVTVWICCLGSIYLARFVHGRWRHMRVIEASALIGSPQDTADREQSLATASV